VKPRDEQKIQQIYAATLKGVQERGLAGVTMSEIAREAGIATGTLYIYFTSKEDLINALYSECRKSSAGVFFRGYSEQEPFKPGFRKIYFNIVRHRVDHFGEAIFMEQCYHSPFLSEATREESRKIMDPLYSLMERGKREQLVKDLDIKLLLLYMVGTINEVVKQYHYSGKKITRQTTESIFKLCWDGIKV